jgi:hypothetical protein
MRTPTNSRSNGRIRGPILCTLTLLACEQESTADQLEDLVPRVYLDSVYAGHAELAQDGSHASRATASVEIYFRDPEGNPVIEDGENGSYYVRGTCGATFISPHYAITAAHCVNEKHLLDGEGVHLQTYDIKNADPNELLGLAAIDGKHPDYKSFCSDGELEGYEVKSHYCFVEARCSRGELNCESGADLALLHCPDREDDGPWLPIADSDPGTGSVEMYWFHEILDVPIQQPPGSASDEENDRFEHYTKFPPGLSEADAHKLGSNFHYVQSPTNVIMPLRSLPWPNGQERQRFAGSRADVYACHGTSGSGILQRSAEGWLELLGPVSLGGVWSSTRLCMDPTNQEASSNDRITYVPNDFLKELVIQYEDKLIADRLGGGEYEK